MYPIVRPSNKDSDQSCIGSFSQRPDRPSNQVPPSFGQNLASNTQKGQAKDLTMNELHGKGGWVGGPRPEYRVATDRYERNQDKAEDESNKLWLWDKILYDYTNTMNGLV